MTSRSNELSPKAVQQALKGAFAFISLVDSYKRYLRDNIWPNPAVKLDPKTAERHFAVISDINSISALATIWKHTEYPAPGGRVLTRQALGKALQETDRALLSFNAPQKYVQRARRLVDAAEIFGLVRLPSVETRTKPLLGTRELHSLMVSVFGEFVEHLRAGADAARATQALTPRPRHYGHVAHGQSPDH